MARGRDCTAIGEHQTHICVWCMAQRAVHPTHICVGCRRAAHAARGIYMVNTMCCALTCLLGPLSYPPAAADVLMMLMVATSASAGHRHSMFSGPAVLGTLATSILMVIAVHELSMQSEVPSEHHQYSRCRGGDQARAGTLYSNSNNTNTYMCLSHHAQRDACARMRARACA